MWNAGSGGTRRPRTRCGLSTIINYERQGSTSYSDSRKGGNPFVLYVLVRTVYDVGNILRITTRHFPQLVGDWLYGNSGV